MPVTREQAQALASLARSIRPHGARHWDEAGVMAALGKVRNLALADVALAVIRAADDRSLETPGAIGNPSAPCWKERRTDRPQTVEPHNPDVVCHVCSKPEHRHNPATAGHDFESVVAHARRLAADPRRQDTPVTEDSSCNG